MGTQTTNYSFHLPTPGADEDTWGDPFSGGADPSADPSPGLNGNWEKADLLFKNLEDQLTTLQNQILAQQIQIGGLYFSEVATNPNTLLGYGNWVQYAEGLAIVGVGDNGEHNWAAGEIRGSDTHILIEAELPVHVHNVDPPATNTTLNGSHIHPINAVVGSGGTGNAIHQSGPLANETPTNRVTIVAGGDHVHVVDIDAFDSASTGNGQGHDNVQPSIAVYVWKRVP